MKIYLAGTPAGWISEELNSGKVLADYPRLYSFYDISQQAFCVADSVKFLIDIQKGENENKQRRTSKHTRRRKARTSK